MIYLKQFYFAKEEDEYDFVSDQKMTCFNSYYPFNILPRNQFRRIDCDRPITIFYGGNGSGKTTALNIIAEKFKLQRTSVFNKTSFFENYLEFCNYETENEIYITQLSTINLDLLYKECYIDLSSATHYTNYEVFIIEKEQIFYIDYICGKHSLPVISDNDLNTIVDNKQERLSVTELSTIMEMVKSRDKENVNLALKLFAQFNLSSDPTLSWLFLSIYSQHFAGINSVLYTNLKKQFNPQSRAYYWGILNSLSKEKPKDDHETELITHLLQDYLTVSNLSVKTFLEFKNLGYDLKLENDE